MDAGVCSVYLFDESDQRYVLMVSEGLCRSIGRCASLCARGWWVCSCQEEPLNLENADKHPNFAYFEETGESPFHPSSVFPLSTTEKCLGSWCSRKPEKGGDEEEAFVVTVQFSSPGP